MSSGSWTLDTAAASIRVLLVDDHDLVRTAVERLLRTLPGIQVVASAGGGREALFLIPQARPDVILMDLSMPGLDGIQATRTIRLAFPETPVIALTAYAEPEWVAAALAAGVRGYLVKGGDADELLEAVRAVAEGGRWLSARAELALRAIHPDAGA
ncbi:MAG: response regulator transcription factor [Chloroflexi bacterium]|nr:MAG: response regulator transcription factor [Chloroflexota bacterium]